MAMKAHYIRLVPSGQSRRQHPPDYRYNDYGFRVVLTVDPLLN